MRLFYDTYTTRARSELLLFLADSVAITSVVLLACGALRRHESSLDLALIPLWAVIPRGVSKILGWMGRRTIGPTLFRNSVILVIATAGLTLTGSELVYLAAPADMRITAETFLSLLLAWGSTFLLFIPSVYGLYDLFLFTTIFLALREGKPDAFLWLPIFFVAYYFSCNLRHILYDSLPHRRLSAQRASNGRFPVNLQNARVLSFLGAAASCVVFFGAYQLLHGGLNFPAHQTKSVDVHRAAIDTELAAEDEAALDAAADVNSPWVADDELFRTTTQRRVGFRYSVSLRDLTLARYDKREVLRVKPADDKWRPPAGILWKAVSFSIYDAETEEWIEEAKYEQRDWPSDQRLVVAERPSAATQQSGALVQLDFRVINPVCRNFVTPYHPLEIVASGLDSYRLDTSGDIFPTPMLDKESAYSALIYPQDTGFVPPVRSADVGEAYLAIPPEKKVGLDLVRFAGDIFTVGSPTPQKIATLQQYFRENYRYSNHAHWQGGDSPVAVFLLQKRIGDCTYHATAATLLLRGAGIPARLAVGFLGSLWSPKTSEVVVRNSQAHAWVEYYVDNSGWHPLDPTSWVPVDASYRAPISPFARRRRLFPAEDPGDMPWEEAEFVEPEQPSASSFSNDGTVNRWSSSETLPVAEQEFDPLHASQDEYAQAITWLGMTEVVVEDVLIEPPQEDKPQDFHLDDVWQPPHRGPADGSSAPIAASESDDHRGRFSLEKWRPALRVGLATAGVFVLALLVLSFLKPRRDEEDEDEESDEETNADELAWELTPAVIEGLNPERPRDRVLLEYIRLQEDLERTRSHRLAHQTPLEHGQRVGRGHPELERTFLRLHRILYRALYRGSTVSPGDVADATESCRKIRRRLG